MFRVFLFALLLSFSNLSIIHHEPANAQSRQDFIVYSVYTALHMGNPGELKRKDFYINMGTQNGLQTGVVLNVYRKAASYDLISKKLFRDLTFPIGQIKIIHAEPKASIARLVKMNPPELTPAISPQAIRIGDIVRPAQK